MIANDFGSLQAARSRRNESEISNWFRGIDEGQQLAALDENFRQNDVRNQLTARQLRQQAAEQAYFRGVNAENRGFRDREFDWRKTNAQADRDWHLKNTAVAEAKLAAHERAVQEQEQEQAGIDRFNYEQGLAEQGLGGSSNKLSDEENAMLWETRGSARKELELKNNYFRNIADSMNVNPAAYENMIAAEKEKSWNTKLNRDPENKWNPNRWFMDRTDDAAIQEWTSAADVARKRQAGAIRAMADKNFPQERIIEREGRYSVPALPWESMVFSPPPLVTPAAPRAATQTKYRVGQRAEQGGLTYEFNGRDWVPLQ